MPKKILLADDSITIQKVIGLTFANEDVLLTVVDNGDEAMIKAKEIIPDLIIADVVMPGKDGYEVCYSTKADPDLQHIPVLLLTGTFETFDETMATKVGADGFITKPFESQALIDKVNELIGRAATRSAPSINDLSKAGTQTPSHDLDDPMNNIDSMDTMDAFEPVESLDPVESLEPVDAIEPMDLEEIAAVEENPMEEFASMTPDSAESSFADVSLDEPVAAKSAFDEPETSFSDFDLSSAASEPEPVAAAPAPARIPMERPSIPSGNPATEADWNMGGLNDYMAEDAGASQPASAAESVVPAAAASDFDSVESIDMEPHREQPAAFSDTPEISEYEEPAAVNEPISAESDVWNTPQNSVQAALAVEADAFDDAPVAVEDTPFDDAPVSLDDAPVSLDDAPVSLDDAPVSLDDAPVAVEEAPLSLESVDAPASFDDAPASFDDDLPAADSEPLQESFGATPVAEEYSDEPVAEAAPSLPPTPVEIADVDGSMEITSVAAFSNPTLDQVADMYPLDDAPAPLEVKPLAASVFDAPPAPVQDSLRVTPAAAALSSESFELQSQRLSEMIESRVRATLADDKVLSAFSEQASRLVEAKIEEAINKVAPQVIEQLVRKALTDATEKILNETIGRLRNG